MLAERRKTGRVTLGLSRLRGCLLLIAALASSASGDPFYMGGDISLETFMQQQNPATHQPNARFFDNGIEAPMDTIMYDHGANLFRLRIFVNPATAYNNTNVGAIQSQAYDIALAQQIKADCPNAKILLDFHYSDTWADPGHQTLPAAWASPSQTLAQLESTVQNYTQTTLQAFKDAGAVPDIVQLGNETTGGIMWPTGKLNFNGSIAQQNASWAAYGGLLNAGIAGVRAVQDPGQRIPIALSIDKGDKDGQPQYHYGLIQRSTTVAVGGLTGGGVTDFDIEGVDFYPSSTDLITTMQTNLTTLANTNYSSYMADLAAHPDSALPMKQIMVLENAYPWTTSSVGSSQWPKTPAGQLAELAAVRDLVLGLPHNDGAGLLYWYPEAVRVPSPGTGCCNIYNDGATALFDSNLTDRTINTHNSLPVLSAFAVTLGDYNRNGIVDSGDYTVWRDTLGSATDLHADGDHNGIVDQADYDFWTAHFGMGGGVVPTPGAAATTTSVPEPASWILLFGLAIAMVGVGAKRS